MKATKLPNGALVLTLSRSNLQALLAKLDGYPKKSEATIFKRTDAGVIIVSAEEDQDHYTELPRGPMHPETEKRMAEMKNLEPH